MSSAPENVDAEQAAWAQVLLAWDDEARHRSYLDGFPDLEGLAVAGRRYRDALAEHPGDPIATRFRDEVLKRAMVQGLASIPRTAPPGRNPRTLVRAVLVAVVVALGAVAWWMVDRLRVVAGAVP